MQDLKNNPIITILLAIITVISAAMFASNLNSTNQLWNKLDRVTALMMRESDNIRADMKDLQKLSICHDQDIAKIKERIQGHIDFTDRELYNHNNNSNNNNYTGKKGGS